MSRSKINYSTAPKSSSQGKKPAKPFDPKAERAKRARDRGYQEKARETDVYQAVWLCTLAVNYHCYPVFKKQVKTASTVCTFIILGVIFNNDFIWFDSKDIKTSFKKLLQFLNDRGLQFETKKTGIHRTRIDSFSRNGKTTKKDKIYEDGLRYYKNVFKDLLNDDKDTATKNIEFVYLMDDKQNIYFKSFMSMFHLWVN